MKVLAFDTKSKARIREHGDEWTPVLNARGFAKTAITKVLMQAPDGYMKWWPISYIEGQPGWIMQKNP